MDKPFSSPYLQNKSNFSPLSRTHLGSRRSTGPSGYKKSSRLSVSGRSNQSIQVILKSHSNLVELFGQPLPVLVTEALTFADRNTVVSARISSECGYAWLVCGRRLLIWQFRQNIQQDRTGTPRKSISMNQCHELQLPQSDLSHRAELIQVFFNESSSSPLCIAVSPEGTVRYWPSIIHEGVSLEQAIDLQGQECDSLTVVPGLGCILATTTCTIVLIQPDLQSGRNVLSCHTLKMPSGWLGGIGKRMSSLIFGLNSEQAAETRLVRVLTTNINEDNWIIYVLAGHSLQKWCINVDSQEHLIYVCDLTRLVREGFFGTAWENSGGDVADIDTWILDLQADNDNITFLTAAVNLHISPQIHYSLMTVDARGRQLPTQFINFMLIKMNVMYREDNPSESLGYRFLLCANSAYIYNHRTITVVKPREEVDNLEFNAGQDFILGGSICVNTAVFFSRNHGLVAVHSSNLVGDINLSMVSNVGTPLETSLIDGGGNLSLYNFDPVDIFTAYKDVIGQLKAAFIFHINNQIASCDDILHELFLSGVSLPMQDSILDKAVIDLSNDLLDDAPANDPRWLGESQVGIGSSYAMHVQQQLQDKQKAHNLFIKFLKDTELWGKLSLYTYRNTVLATTHVLMENSEKIIVAITLKSLNCGKILQNAIINAASDLESERINGLTHQDVFYRHVGIIHKSLKELVNNCDEMVHSDLSLKEVVDLIHESNVIILNVLKEAFKFRQDNINEFCPCNDLSQFEFLPWTSASGESGLMDSLISQQFLTYNYAIKPTTNHNLHVSLYEQLVLLIDFILDGRKAHLESIKEKQNESVLLKQYQVDRKNFIKPLIDEEQWDGAALLAEKYLDYESLVFICDKTSNEARLDEYMERFGQEFSRFVYSWYLQENKQAKLLQYGIRKVSDNKMLEQLNEFLSEHPSLFWIQNIFNKNFTAAGFSLVDMAQNETNYIQRKKTMLSMAKLTLLTKGEDKSLLENIDLELQLVLYQEELPDYVLQQFGYNSLKPQVIPPKDIITLYTCPEYTDATEIEFQKALDLLNFIQDPQLKENLMMHIWKQAILRDEWNEQNLDSPLEILQQKMMFKLADMSLILGADPLTLLPPLEILLEDAELNELRTNKGFEFLLKTGYEHIAKLML